MRLRGAAEPPMGMQRIDEMSHCGSFSRMAWMAIHTVGTAPTSVTRSLWTISMMSRGCGLGPPRICVEPFMTPAKGTHQALAWNMGTMCRMTSRSQMPSTSTVDVLGICERDVILHIVPMFHANAWCVPFAGVMNGSTQILGGPNPQPRDIIEIVHNERVTLVGAVPTVWIAIQAILEKEPQWDISSIRCIPIGGSAAPRSLIEKFDKKYGAPMLHAWGMTAMTPLGTVCRLKSYMG